MSEPKNKDKKEIAKIWRGIWPIVKGCLIVFISYIIHNFLLSFITYILIEEKTIEGGISRGYFESIRLAFQHTQVLQFLIVAFIILAIGLFFGLPKIIAGFILIFRKNK